ncbi:MAG: leucine-rich repeat domain-containing protein, partial [Treponema sp.]|nr:leucine-rich repeat domain-containing protein [Treponema sp.]
MKKLFTRPICTLLAAVFVCFSAIALFSGCDFTTVLEPDFNAPVKNFFKDYTESAAIENFVSSVPVYQDVSGRACLDSSELCTISFFMRNPQRYELTPSVTFDSLDESVDTSAVSITQSDVETIQLTLPQSFLVAADEGKSISPTVSLYEPKSGRSFPSYTASLSCNSKPPFLYNATVLNNGGESFVIAFDMPEAAELALRHKDLCSLTINGTSYELSVDNGGGFTFADSRFTTSWSENYVAVGSKIFTHTNRSVYFATGDAFVNGDREYSLTLSDTAGLTSGTLASTKITKLNQPTLHDETGSAFADSSSVSISLLDGKETAVITLKAPSTDQLGNAVTGTSVHYKLYHGSRTSATLNDSGSFTGSKDLSLKNGTWYLEAYASKTNYENSSPLKCSIYVSGATIFVSPDGNDNDDDADGTAALPFRSLEKALTHIQDLHTAGMDTYVDWTISVTGSLSGNSGIADVSFEAGSVKSLLIAGSGEACSIESIAAGTDNDGFVLKIKNIAVEGALTLRESTSAALQSGTSVNLLSGTSVAECTVNGGSLSLETGAGVTTCTVNGGSLSLGTGSSVSTCTLHDGNISLGDGTEVSAISWKSGSVTLTGNLSEDAQITVTPLVYAATEPQFLAAENAYNEANCEKFTVVDNDDTDDIKWFIAADGKLKQRLKASASGDGIIYYENESDIAVQVEADGTVLTATAAVEEADVWTFTAPEGYSLSWKVDGQSCADDSPYEGIRVSGNVLTLSLRLWPTGVYDVFLAATKDGTLYSYHAQIQHTCTVVFGSNAASYIRSMTASGSVAIVGTLTAEQIAEINTAIKEKYTASSSFRVDLDLGAVTGLTEIPENAFKSNNGLRSVVLPDGVTSIGKSAFYECEKLTTINLPDGFTDVGEYAFYYCRQLTDVVFPDTITSVGDHSFESAKLTSLVLPEGFTSLGYECFAKNQLQSISIPSTVKTIPQECFFANPLTTVTLPEGVETLSKWSFWSCSQLTSIELPSTVKSIHSMAFDSASKLVAINIAESNSAYKSIDGVVYKYNDDGSLSLALYPRAKGISYVIPADANVTSIESEFCYWANQNGDLAELTIPVSVTNIKKYAFVCCNNLTTLNYSGTMAQWNAITKENDWKYSLASYALGATVVKCSDGDVDLILFMTDVSNIKGAASDSS